MSKATNAALKELTTALDAEQFLQEGVFEYTRNCMIMYGTDIIQDRVVPDFRDGLIPVQRRIMWAMYQLGVSKSAVKSARVVGEVLGKYHPHGDTGVYGAMVTMVQAPLKLIHGMGNWGRFDDPSAVAAQRYTECKLSDFAAKAFFSGSLPESCDYMSNFDGEFKEPVVLNSHFPVALCLGKLSGIAVGLVANIPSYTVESVAELTEKALMGEAITPEMCLETLDFQFSWGGQPADECWDDGRLLTFYKTGRSAVPFVSDYEYKEAEGCIYIRGLAPNCSYETAMEKTKAAGYPVEDLSTMETGMEIRVTLKKQRGHVPSQADITKIVKIWTGSSIPLATIFTYRRATEEATRSGSKQLDTSFATLPIPKFLNSWAKYRLSLEKTLATIEQGKLSAEKHNLDLILLARANIDTIKKSLDENDPIKYVADALEITIEDSRYIMSRTLLQLSKTDIQKTKARITQVLQAIKVCKDRIKNPAPYAVEAMKGVANV